MGSLALVKQPVSEKENSKSKPALLNLKLTLRYILREMEGLGKYIN